MTAINKIEYFIGGAADKNDFLSGVTGGGTKVMWRLKEEIFRLRMKTLPVEPQLLEYRGHEQEDSIVQEIWGKRAANPRLVVNLTGHS